MKCTECSGVVRPIMVWDIDGTLTRYHSDLGEFLVRYYNLPYALMRAGAEWDGEGNFEDQFGLTQTEYRAGKLAFRQGGHKRVATTWQDGGLMAVQELAERGVETWYATTRPWARLDNVDPDTKFWIKRHHLPIDGILFDDDKYETLIANHVDPERIIGIVEDLPEQYDAADRLGLPVMQVARAHNSGRSGNRPRRGNMRQVRQWALQNLQDWNELHG